jgi:hypothetical protein
MSLRNGGDEGSPGEQASGGIQEENMPDKTAPLQDSNSGELASDPVIPSETQEETVDDSMQSASRKEAEKIAAMLTDCYDNWRKMKTLEMDIEEVEVDGVPLAKSPSDETHIYLENSFEATSQGEKYSHKTRIEFRHPEAGIFDSAVWIDGKEWEWRRDRQGNLVGDIKPGKARKDEFLGHVYPAVSLFREFIADSREHTISRIMGMNRESIGNLRENVSIDFGDGEKVSSTLITTGFCEWTIDEHKRLRRSSVSRRGKDFEGLFNQYTNYDGLWYPQKITLIKDWGPEATEIKLILKLSNVSINKGIPPEKFVLPKLP